MAWDRVAQLRQLIDDCLSDNLDRLADGPLHEEVIGLYHELSRFKAACARRVSAWDRRRTWADNGSRSAAARLAAETGLSLKTTRAEVRRARRLKEMSATAQALADGTLSVDKVDLLVRARIPRNRELFARDETVLVEGLAGLRYAQAQIAVRHWCLLADDETGESPGERQHADRFRPSAPSKAPCRSAGSCPRSTAPAS